MQGLLSSHGKHEFLFLFYFLPRASLAANKWSTESTHASVLETTCPSTAKSEVGPKFQDHGREAKARGAGIRLPATNGCADRAAPPDFSARGPQGASKWCSTTVWYLVPSGTSARSWCRTAIFGNLPNLIGQTHGRWQKKTAIRCHASSPSRRVERDMVYRDYYMHT